MISKRFLNRCVYTCRLISNESYLDINNRSIYGTGNVSYIEE